MDKSEREQRDQPDADVGSWMRWGQRGPILSPASSLASIRRISGLNDLVLPLSSVAFRGAGVGCNRSKRHFSLRMESSQACRPKVTQNLFAVVRGSFNQDEDGDRKSMMPLLITALTITRGDELFTSPTSWTIRSGITHMGERWPWRRQDMQRPEHQITSKEMKASHQSNQFSQPRPVTGGGVNTLTHTHTPGSVQASACPQSFINSVLIN